METLLLLAFVFGMVVLCWRVAASERPGGAPGLGIFEYRDAAADPASRPERSRRRA